MDQQKKVLTPIALFYSYANVDEDMRLRDELEKHLSLLKQQGIITTWHQHQIVPGSDRASTINQHLEAAKIILLLISSDFLASPYLDSKEMTYALQRAYAEQAVVIPVILRPCSWEDAPFARFQPLPRDGRPVKSWEDQDEAFSDIVEGIRETVKRLSSANSMLPPLPAYTPPSTLDRPRSIAFPGNQPNNGRQHKSTRQMLSQTELLPIVPLPGKLSTGFPDQPGDSLDMRSPNYRLLPVPTPSSKRQRRLEVTITAAVILIPLLFLIFLIIMFLLTHWPH